MNINKHKYKYKQKIFQIKTTRNKHDNIYIYIYVNMYVFMYVCMYVCIYIYMYICLLKVGCLGLWLRSWVYGLGINTKGLRVWELRIGLGAIWRNFGAGGSPQFEVQGSGCLVGPGAIGRKFGAGGSPQFEV